MMDGHENFSSVVKLNRNSKQMHLPHKSSEKMEIKNKNKKYSAILKC
jgi:hypothetical protein